MAKTVYTNRQWAVLIGRLTIGVNFLIHGLVRIPKLSKFAEGLTKGFSDTYLPDFLVSSFAHGLPFLEAGLGILLLIGFRTRFASIVGAFLITILIFGSALKEDWTAVGGQMTYAIFFFLLISNLEHNVFALDSKTKTKFDGFSTKE